MAASTQNEAVLDLEQVTLQEAPLPPPIQRVMDPGQFTCVVVLEDAHFGVSPCAGLFY